MTVRAPSSAERSITLDISVLGRAYTVACKEHERTELLAAVAFLDRRMREIRDTGKIAGVERIAVMAALNIAHELLRARQAPATTPTPSIDAATARRRIDAMQSVIDKVLSSA